MFFLLTVLNSLTESLILSNLEVTKYKGLSRLIQHSIAVTLNWKTAPLPPIEFRLWGGKKGYIQSRKHLFWVEPNGGQIFHSPAHCQCHYDAVISKLLH